MRVRRANFLDDLGIWFYLARTEAAMNLRHCSEKLQMAIAWRVPRWLAYWCAMRVIGHATTGKYSGQVVPELSAMDALKRWDRNST